MRFELTQAGFLFLPATILLCYLSKPSWIVLWTVLLAPFEAASVLNIYLGNYVFGIQPGYLGAMALLWSFGIRALLRGGIWNGYRLVGFYTPLILFVAYAVLSAFILPELFAGRVEVFPPREGIVLTKLAPLQASTTNISQALYILFLAVVAFVVSSVVAQCGNARAVLKAYVTGGVLVSLVGLYQLLAFYWTLPYPTDFLYSNPAYVQGYAQMLGQLKRVSSTLTEPSVFAYYIGGIVAALAGNYLFSRQRFLTCALVAFVSAMLLLSTSSTAYLSFGVLSVILFTAASRSKSSRGKIILHGSALAALATPILLLAWKSGLDELVTYVLRSAIVEKATSISFVDRIGTDVHSFRLVVQTYGLGVGWGSNRSSSFVTNLISNAGIPGTFLLCAFAIRVTRVAKRAVKRGRPDTPVAISLGLSLLAMLVAGAISNPDLTHVVFWVNLGALVGLGLQADRPPHITAESASSQRPAQSTSSE